MLNMFWELACPHILLPRKKKTANLAIRKWWSIYPNLTIICIPLGNALSALDRKEDALHVWEQGYKNVVHKSADLKQLLELEELLVTAKENKANLSKKLVLEYTEPLSPGSILEAVCSRNSVTDSSSSNMSTSTSNIDFGSQGKDVDFENQNKCTESETDNAYEDTCEICVQSSEDPKTFTSTHGNVFVKSLSLDFRLSRGIALVNLY